VGEALVVALVNAVVRALLGALVDNGSRAGTWLLTHVGQSRQRSDRRARPSLGALEIARRRAEPGWRAAVLDEGASRHAFRLRASLRSALSIRPVGRQRLTSASLSERNEQCARSERRRSFLCERPHQNARAKRAPGLSDELRDEVGGFSMFGPPISNKSRERSEHQPQRRAVCRRRCRNNAFPFRRLRRRRRQPSEHRRERKRAIRHSAMREQAHNQIGSPVGLR
jgi:hypothetical protein